MQFVMHEFCWHAQPCCAYRACSMQQHAYSVRAGRGWSKGRLNESYLRRWAVQRSRPGCSGRLQIHDSGAVSMWRVSWHLRTIQLYCKGLLQHGLLVVNQWLVLCLNGSTTTTCLHVSQAELGRMPSKPCIKSRLGHAAAAAAVSGWLTAQMTPA
jgi:hypothetical protein